MLYMEMYKINVNVDMSNLCYLFLWKQGNVSPTNGSKLKKSDDGDDDDDDNDDARFFGQSECAFIIVIL